jgi:hypothetical protein
VHLLQLTLGVFTGLGCQGCSARAGFWIFGDHPQRASQRGFCPNTPARFCPPPLAANQVIPAGGNAHFNIVFSLKTAIAETELSNKQEKKKKKKKNSTVLMIISV